MAVLRNTKNLWLAMFVVVAATVTCLPAAARSTADMQLNAQKIEAGLIYNFLKYTVWPQSSLSGNMVVCLFGGDPFDGKLDPLEGRTAQQYVISIKRIYRVESLDGCHLVFIPQSQRAALRNILARSKGKAILTVSNIPNFAVQGGMVEFYTGPDQRMHLNINTKAVSGARLHIQDRMVKLSEVVHK
ncbi:MAG: YfiR family protein [Micavibrio sp.]